MHVTVLKNESIEGLNLAPGMVYVDGTAGGGGHAEAVFQKFGNDIRMILLDRDEDAIARSLDRLGKLGATNVTGEVANFRDADAVLEKLGIAKADAMLLDLGLSSFQLESSGRGFSFKRDEPLLMTFEKGRREKTAFEVINTYPAADLASIFREFGEERFAGRIAAKIVEEREGKRINTSEELKEIIVSAVPSFVKFQKTHPATKTFQALRIFVNDELSSLQDLLAKAPKIIADRLAIISFHSLEDRIVKHTFREMAEAEQGIIITKKAIIPTDEEIMENPRSRSAKLRIISFKQS